MHKRILVLGGKGFIGSHLVGVLAVRGFAVRVFDRGDAENLIPQELHARIEIMDGDLSRPADVAAALEGCDACFHLVSATIPQTSNEAPAYDLQSNVLGTLNLLEAARKAGLGKIVFLSSGGTVYGIPEYTPIDERHPTDPICAYGISKLAAEKYLALYRRLYGLDYTVLRVSNVYGERQRLAAAQGAAAVFLGKIWHGERVTIWGDGSAARDYVYIGDVVSALLAAMDYSGRETVFNIGSGRATTLLELIHAIEAVTGKQAEVQFMPSRALDVPANVLDTGRAGRELGWVPETSLRQGLARMRDWLAGLQR